MAEGLPWRRIGPDAHRRMPWKNGQGVTAEIAAAPDPDGRLAWRLSLADVATSGPFSDFAGLDRWITLVRGLGMRLDFDGAAPAVTLDRPFQPVRFDGGWSTQCHLLGGPILDFNLMVDRSLFTAEVAMQRGGARDLRLSAGGWLLLHEFTGRARLHMTDDETALPAGETLVFGPAPDAVQFRVAGDAATICFLARLDPVKSLR